MREIAGTWTAIRELCDPELGQRPSAPPPPVSLTLTADGRYRRTGNGAELEGAFTLDRPGHGLTVRLDQQARLAHYVLRGGRLENWGEGDAVYPCALVFARIDRPPVPE